MLSSTVFIYLYEKREKNKNAIAIQSVVQDQ